MKILESKLGLELPLMEESGKTSVSMGRLVCKYATSPQIHHATELHKASLAEEAHLSADKLTYSVAVVNRSE